MTLPLDQPVATANLFLMSTRRPSPAVIERAAAELTHLGATVLVERHAALRARVQARLAALPTYTADPSDPAPYHRRSPGGIHTAAVRAILADEVIEGLALAGAAALHALGYAPRVNQYATALALLEGKVVDLATGEGKTLAAALAASLLAASGQGVHIATANSYLAGRDATWMAPLYTLLGLDSASIRGLPGSSSRRDAYRASIAYATAEGLAYDTLYDGRVMQAAQRVARRAFALILDEADSLLVDLARSPIVMTRPVPVDDTMVREIAAFVATLPGPDAPEPAYTVDEVYRAAGPTDHGITLAAEQLGNIYADEPGRVRAFQLAIEARALFLIDRDYLIRDGAIVPIDRRTGRASNGRFRGGFAVALAAKEGLDLPDEEIVQAETTIPALVASYPLVAGMSGSAAAAEEELANAYGLAIERVAPHRPCVRVDSEDRLFADRAQSLAAAVEAARVAHESGRPVLLGALDVSAAETASAALTAAGLPHELLTARDNVHEAEILADAGAPGAITVTAAIAGRGVDILLGGRPDHVEALERRERVVAAGGLAIIGIGRHDERRLDEQLKGRAGRAGDPGSSVFYLSADDRLFRAVGAERLRKMLERLGHGQRALYGRAINRAVESAQTRLGGFAIDARSSLRTADEPFARQRVLIASERARLIDGADPLPSVRDALRIAAHEAIATATVSELQHEWDMQSLTGALLRIGVREDEVRAAATGVRIRSREDLMTSIDPLLDQVFARRLSELGGLAEMTLRIAVLMAVDRIYEEHLGVIADLRAARSLRNHGAGRAATSYSLEVAKLYDEYRLQLAREIARTALHLTPSRREA